MKLPILSELEAKKNGFTSLTVPVSASREPHIINSLEFTLAPTGAVWVDVGRGYYEAARRASQLAPLAGRSGIKNKEGSKP